MTNMWHQEEYDLIGYLGVTDFKIRFLVQASHASEDVLIDDVKIISASLPDTAMFDDDFEGNLSSWILSGDSNWRTTSAHDRSSAHSSVMASSNCDNQCISTINETFDASSKIYISFDRFIDSEIESNEGLDIQYSTNGDTWQNIERYIGSVAATNTWESESLILETSHPFVQIRLVAYSDSSAEHIQVDNFMISKQSITSSDSAPTISSISDISMRYTDQRTVNVIASDPDRHPITLSLQNPPSYVTMTSNGGSGTISINPEFGDIGSDVITVKASANGQSDLEIFSITVTRGGGGGGTNPPSDTTPPTIVAPARHHCRSH